MDIENIGGYNLRNLWKINILMGKNGCGKSRALRMIRATLQGYDWYGQLKYISPERSWSLTYDSGIDNAIHSAGQSWVINSRAMNQVSNFKSQTVTFYKDLELLTLRRFQDDQTSKKFGEVIASINSLLTNIEIRSSTNSFEIYDKATNQQISPSEISSGESELLSLAIESLVFHQEKISWKVNILFLDEPDVHLHPDLQVRLMTFFEEEIISDDTMIILSTHSTAILGAYSNYDGARICFMKNRQNDFIFEEISDIYKKILPIFGAHPLSNIFNESPILIVEWEDDVRVWQQVVRSSNGIIDIYPCDAWSKDEISEMENDTKKILEAVYDNAIWFSLRDKDENPEEIWDELPIVRFRLSCRNAESMILSNEAITKAWVAWGWDEVKESIQNWINEQDTKGTEDQRHMHYSIFKEFEASGFDRKSFDLKVIRNDIMHILGSSKPWEILIWQSIAENIQLANAMSVATEGSIFNFLWEKIVETILSQPNES